MQEQERKPDIEKGIARVSTIEILNFNPAQEVAVANTHHEYKVAVVLMSEREASVVHLVDHRVDDEHNGVMYRVSIEKDLEPEDAMEYAKYLCITWAGLDLEEDELEDLVGFYSPNMDTSRLLYADRDKEIILPTEEEALERNKALERIDNASKRYRMTLLFD